MYVIRGIGFLRSHRVLWKYAAAPAVLGAMVFGGSYYLVYRFYSRFAASLEVTQRFGVVIYSVVLGILIAFLLLILFFLFGRIVSALAAPFNEMISKKTEELVSGVTAESPFSLAALFKDTGRALAHSFKLLGLYVALLVGALVLLLIPGIGALLYAVMGVVTSALLFAFEYFGYSMDRRRFSWQEKMKLFRSKPQSVLGFGLGVVVLGYVPVVNVLFIPASVIGGTLLFLDLTEESAADRITRNSTSP